MTIGTVLSMAMPFPTPIAPAADPRRKKREQQEKHDGESQLAHNDLALRLPDADDGGRIKIGT
jgi:hypothetical protein